VHDECACFTAHEPWLTLYGLELVYASNHSPILLIGRYHHPKNVRSRVGLCGIALYEYVFV